MTVEESKSRRVEESEQGGTVTAGRRPDTAYADSCCGSPRATAVPDPRPLAPGPCLRGRVHRYGDNVNTDEIIPARYLNTSDVAELAAHCLEDIDLDFVKHVKPGDIIVGGENFGCGSSREHAPLALKGAGVSGVIAASFARIFFRNAINIGLPVLVAPDAAADAQRGDELEVDLTAGTIKNVTQGRQYQAAPFPAFLQELIAAGGLMAQVRARLERG